MRKEKKRKPGGNDDMKPGEDAAFFIETKHKSEATFNTGLTQSPLKSPTYFCCRHYRCPAGPSSVLHILARSGCTLPLAFTGQHRAKSRPGDSNKMVAMTQENTEERNTDPIHLFCVLLSGMNQVPGTEENKIPTPRNLQSGGKTVKPVTCK